MTASSGAHAADQTDSSPRKVALVGSTGSIGTQAVDVIRADSEHFEVVALGARDSIELLAAQAQELRPQVVVLADPERASELGRLVPKGTEVLTGPEGLVAIAGPEGGADVVLNAVVGFAGLGVTLATLGAGKRLALANKESLIAGGAVVAKVRSTPGAEIVPVDSEHCALHQCLRAGSRSEVGRLVLTASGGPFRGLGASDLEGVGVEEALAHPTWRMGPKVTVDSSTLMNKGLEVIEAHQLFGVSYDRISVVVHPQSIVHSMVVFSDGSTIAQMADPDMRMPIGYALGYPDRSQHAYGALDWQKVRRLDFELPDRSVFRCLELAESAGRIGGLAPAWLNAGNEVAVAAFLEGRIAWSAIADVVSDTMQAFDGAPATDAPAVVDADARARLVAQTAVSAVRAA
jgi:1-deoxy-D-xylulose-5-phosphate reductoisomerase